MTPPSTLPVSTSSTAPTSARLGRFGIGGYMWIFLAALALRGIYLWEAFQNNELIAYPVVDAKVYVEWSRDILAGEWLWQSAINYTPIVPIWIAGVTALLGWFPAAHFGLFFVLASAQAVLLGKTAELLWNRRVGLATGWLAALYWPLIIFEGSYFSEPFAIWNLTVALYLIVRWTQRGGSYLWLAWAGLHLGFSILARANALLCLPILVAWVFWIALPRNRRAAGFARGLASAVALVLPPVLLCVPILFWNSKITGKPMLRTQGWVSVYVGNLPENRGIAIPVGVRWGELMYQPIRADKITAPDQELYWKGEVFRILRERTGDWLRLLPRKTMLLIGNFEVSQEIDVAVFRAASRLLSLPIWPGWGLLAPLALVTAAAMLRSADARRGLPLLIFAAAYLFSIAPVQVCGRYRLPTVVPLLPLAGYAVVLLIGAARRRDHRQLATHAAVFGASALLIAPDWLGMADEKVINHQFLIGLKRQGQGDSAGAERAFSAGLDWNPADPDCPLYLGGLAMDRGDVDQAEVHYQRARAAFPHGHVALLGLGEVALARGKTDDALKYVQTALAIAPNNQDALQLAFRTHIARQDWTAVALTCRQLRSYPSHAAAVSFAEGRAWILAGRPLEALRVYDLAVQNKWFSSMERSEALYLGGVAAWRMRNSEGALARWRFLTAAPDSFFPALAKVLTGSLTPEELPAHLSAGLGESSALYAAFTLATHAETQGDQALARQRFQQMVEQGNLREKAIGRRDVLEIWALERAAED